MATKTADNMFKLKIDPHLVVFDDYCKRGGGMVVIFETNGNGYHSKWPTT